MEIIKALKRINEKIKDYKITNEEDVSMFMAEDLILLRNYLNVTTNLSVLYFSLLFKKTVISRCLSLVDLTNHFRCSIFEILERQSVIQELEKNNLIFGKPVEEFNFEDNEDNGCEVGEIYYRVTKEIVNCCLKNEPLSNAYRYIGEAPKTNKKPTNEFGLIMPEQTIYKKLLYNQTENKQIMDIQHILNPQNFTKTLELLEKNKMMPAITIIIHGSPGVGKTELVRQMAKKCGRPIKMQDLAIRSKYYGESEVFLKRAFADYRRMLTEVKPEPILFINELDSIATKRMPVGFSSIQSGENTLQNCLLNELENLPRGAVVIGTTNLIRNLDSAYERRFLFKLKINPPSLNVAAKIWQHYIHWISPKKLNPIVESYHNFSPAEIANIAQKALLYEIQNEKKADANIIVDLCKVEKFEIATRATIGFKQ